MRSQLTLPAALIIVAGAAWYAGWALGRGAGFALAVVVSSPVIALAVAPLIVTLLGWSVQTTRQIAYRDIEGSHFEYKGRSVRVHEDPAGDRWLCTFDIRKIVPNFPRDQVLTRIAPEDIGRMGAKGDVFLLALALDRYLERGQDDTTIRFRKWLHREVIYPSPRAGRARTSSHGPSLPAAHLMNEASDFRDGTATPVERETGILRADAAQVRREAASSRIVSAGAPDV